MAYVEQAIYARLKAVAGVTGIVASRIYPCMIPQNTALPAITYRRLSGNRDYVFGGQTGIVDARFEIASWADSYSGVKALAEQVRLALSGYRGSVGGVTIDWISLEMEADIFEDSTGQATGVYQVPTDYRVYYRESIPS